MSDDDEGVLVQPDENVMQFIMSQYNQELAQAMQDVVNKYDASRATALACMIKLMVHGIAADGVEQLVAVQTGVNVTSLFMSELMSQYGDESSAEIVHMENTNARRTLN